LIFGRSKDELFTTRRMIRLWARFWMLWASRSPSGRLAMRLAAWGAPPHRAKNYLARLSPAGFISPTATVHHPALRLGAHVFIGDRTIVYDGGGSGNIELGDKVHLYADACLETSQGGTVTIGAETTVHMRCQLMAHKGSIRIGRGVALAAGCALYPYDHGVERSMRIRDQPISSKGDIVIHDEAWLGTGVIVLAGVTIGEGAVVGAGSVVTRDIPDFAIAVGTPARIVKFRPREGVSAGRATLHPVSAGTPS
jgi:acetyltransferase-like isoleucine patch superfamily enzyme